MFKPGVDWLTYNGFKRGCSGKDYWSKGVTSCEVHCDPDGYISMWYLERNCESVELYPHTQQQMDEVLKVLEGEEYHKSRDICRGCCGTGGDVAFDCPHCDGTGRHGVK